MIEDLDEVARRVSVLVSGWELDTTRSQVTPHRFGDGSSAGPVLSVTYCRERENYMPSSSLYSGFMLNFFYKTRILYLLSIKIPETLRGRGHGKALYDIVVDIGRVLGAVEVRQTASGRTGTDEPRCNYLLRHGWAATTWHENAEFVKALAPQC